MAAGVVRKKKSEHTGGSGHALNALYSAGPPTWKSPTCGSHKTNGHPTAQIPMKNLALVTRRQVSEKFDSNHWTPASLGFPTRVCLRFIFVCYVFSQVGVRPSTAILESTRGVRPAHSLTAPPPQSPPRHPTRAFLRAIVFIFVCHVCFFKVGVRPAQQFWNQLAAFAPLTR